MPGQPAHALAEVGAAHHGRAAVVVIDDGQGGLAIFQAQSGAVLAAGHPAGHVEAHGIHQGQVLESLNHRQAVAGGAAECRPGAA